MAGLMSFLVLYIFLLKMKHGIEMGYFGPKWGFLNLVILQNEKVKVMKICIYWLCTFYSNYYWKKKSIIPGRKSRENNLKTIQVLKKERKTEICCALSQLASKLSSKTKVVFFYLIIITWNIRHEDRNLYAYLKWKMRRDFLQIKDWFDYVNWPCQISYM